MLKRKATCMIFILIFISGIGGSFRIQSARADSAIYINADGSIYPPTSPISTTDNVTYTLTDNISTSDYGIIVERNNTIIDGNGYAVQGPWRFAGNGSQISGVFMTNVSNVKIMNTNVRSFPTGIDVHFSSNITLSDNNLDAYVGAQLYFSSGNAVTDNNVTFCNYGLAIVSSSGNVVSCNNMTKDREGILLWDSSNNTFSQNSFDKNELNIQFYSFSARFTSTTGNMFFHNNFSAMQSWQGQVEGDGSKQIWDNGAEGNYWSDYNGTDNSQDGIGDTPYVIDENNTDHYPLMGTFQSFNVSSSGLSYPLYDEVDIISNATIGKVILIYADDVFSPIGMDLILRLSEISGQNETSSFCRMTFSHAWLNSSNYPWRVDLQENQSSSTIITTNSTSTTIYFTFTQPVTSIDILPEFPFLLILSLFMMATLLATIVCRRRHLT
ncbi:MAG: NosD domain-containing protein [Candidatus Bathyarchaeia archaeon]